MSATENREIPTIITMAGLPATGKSSIACRLAAELGGVILNKDRIRAAIFPPADIEYSKKQDDFCVEITYKAAEYIITQQPSKPVILDGRTYSKTQADPIAAPKLQIDTGLNNLEECIRLSIAYVINPL